MNPDDDSHCLRPTFTGRIAKMLAEGASINLIGELGQGRRRLLDDIGKLFRGEILCLQVNMKTCRDSFRIFLDTLWRQSGLKGRRPVTFGRLIDRLADDGHRVILLFHHFDAILDNPDIDPKYDVAFLDALNALRNRGMSLLCVTSRAYQQYVAVTPEGVRQGSTLDLVREPLPDLAHDEIVTEIARRSPSLGEHERTLLAARVLEHARSYGFLEYVSQRLNNGENAEKPFTERLERWQKAFAIEERRNPIGTAIVWRQKLITVIKALKLDRLRLPGARLLKLLERWLSGSSKPE